MTACNERPPDGHPFAGTGVACHFAADHDGPHAWSLERVELDQELLRTIEEITRMIAEHDLADLDADRREVLIQHLAGALFVRIRPGGDILLAFTPGKAPGPRAQRERELELAARILEVDPHTDDLVKFVDDAREVVRAARELAALILGD
jgi:hypothetical protein